MILDYTMSKVPLLYKGLWKGFWGMKIYSYARFYYTVESTGYTSVCKIHWRKFIGQNKNYQLDFERFYKWKEKLVDEKFELDPINCFICNGLNHKENYYNV